MREVNSLGVIVWSLTRVGISVNIPVMMLEVHEHAERDYTGPKGSKNSKGESSGFPPHFHSFPPARLNGLCLLYTLAGYHPPH